MRKESANMIRALVISGFGINCEVETAMAWKLAGADAHIMHLNKILSGECNIRDYDLITFPGGFSFGDELGSGKILANLLKYSKLPSGKLLFSEIINFLEKGNFILGICNGFQALVQSGLLPNIGGNQVQEATLTFNSSGHFEDRWVRLRHNPFSNINLTSPLKVIDLPIRHGEGRLIFANEKIKTSVVEKNLNCLLYADEQGNHRDTYPTNPNGSELSCAALLDPSARVLGMMPHPEAFLTMFNHPEWPLLQRNKKINAETAAPGLQLFQSILTHVESK